jgi:TonB family protein
MTLTLMDVVARPSAVLLAGFAIRALLARRSAAERHAVLAVTLFAALAVIPLSSIAPGMPVTLPGAIAPQGGRGISGAAPVAAASTLNSTGASDIGPRISDAPRSLPSLAGIWIGGMSFGAALLASALLRVRRIARDAEIVRDPRWTGRVAAMAADAGVRGAVLVLRTDASGVLATTGIVRPRILLPSHALNWPDARIPLVIAHELAHVVRRDWAIQIAAEIVRVCLWFNPLAWLACTLLRRDAERACDDLVLARGVAPATYATELVALARLCRPAPAVRLSAVSMATPSTLERRITAMLNPVVVRTPLSRFTLAAAAVVALALTMPIAGLRAAQTGPATLGGAIYDATGGVMPGVQIVLEGTNEAKWTATSNASGRFEFPAIYPGKYTLAAVVPGFKALKQEFELRDSRDWDRAITLQVGDLRETITVRDTRLAAPAAAQPQFGAPVRVGGNIRAPRKLQDVKPVYPVSMRTAGREGVVPIEAVVGKDGTVTTVRVVSADVHPDFAIAAADAVRQWKFSPTLLNGQPVEVVMMVSVTFTLGD